MLHRHVLHWCRVGELTRSHFLAAVQCSGEEVTAPSKGSVNCTHTYGEFAYESRCQYSCEEGYQLSSPGPLTCTASGGWSEQPPACNCELGDAYVQEWFEVFLPPTVIQRSSSCLQWWCVQRFLLQVMEMWPAQILWVPPAISPLVSLPAMKDTLLLAPRPCSAKKLEFGIPHNHCVPVCLQVFLLLFGWLL